MVAFLGYCLWVALKAKLNAAASSITPARISPISLLRGSINTKSQTIVSGLQLYFTTNPGKLVPRNPGLSTQPLSGSFPMRIVPPDQALRQSPEATLMRIWVWSVGLTV